MTKAGAGGSTGFAARRRPDAYGVDRYRTVLRQGYHCGRLNAETVAATANAVFITAIGAAVLHRAAMLRRPIVLLRRRPGLCTCSGILVCSRIV